MKELGCANVGDRIIFLEFLKLLKKHKRDADRSRALWNGTTPVCNLAYHRGCASFCFQVSIVIILYILQETQTMNKIGTQIFKANSMVHGHVHVYTQVY